MDELYSVAVIGTATPLFLNLFLTKLFWIPFFLVSFILLLYAGLEAKQRCGGVVVRWCGGVAV